MRATPNWANLEIRGFRGLESLELSRLGSFNVLLGVNDVGKTSVLEAIFLLSGLGSIGLPIRVQSFRNYLVHDVDDLLSLLYGQDAGKTATLTASSPGGLRSTLSISMVDVEDTVEASIKPTAKSPGKPSSSSIPPRHRVLRYEVTVVPSELEKPLSFAGTLVDEGDRFGGKMSPGNASDYIVPARFIHHDFGYDADVIANLIVTKNSEELLQYLRVINPSVVAIATDGDVGYLDIGLDKMLPMNMFGSGMIRAAAIVSLCIMKSQRILLIDEIDNGLHHGAIPSLLAALLTLSRDRHIQVFATTHSLEILTGLREVLHGQEFADYRDSTCCYTLQRDKDDLVRAYRYGYADFNHCLEDGMEIR